MSKIEHSPLFDGIAHTVIEQRGKKLAFITLFGTLTVLVIMAGVIYGVNNETNQVVALNLFVLPLFLALTLAAIIRASHHSTALLESLYLAKAQALLFETFDLQLDLAQVKQLGFGQDWRSRPSGVELGSAGTLSDFPGTESRYHSLIAVKDGENAVRLFETKGQAVVTEL